MGRGGLWIPLLGPTQFRSFPSRMPVPVVDYRHLLQSPCAACLKSWGMHPADLSWKSICRQEGLEHFLNESLHGFTCFH